MTTTTEETAGLGALLDELRALLDQNDELNAEQARLRKRRTQIEDAIRRHSEDTGVNRFGNDHLNVTVSEDMVASYDPDHWNELVKWAVETGNLQVIQRRVSTRPVLDLIDSGSELPEGLKLEPQIKVNVRRR